MTGVKYLVFLAEFVRLLQLDMMSTELVTLSLSLTSVATTLTQEQVS
jgi:hypothetical protein